MPTSDIGALVLAAGQASRYRRAAGPDGPATKLVALHEGKPLVRHVVDAALNAGLAPLVVTGHAADAVHSALQGLDVRFAHNPDYATGMASSLRVGLAHLPAHVRGALVLLGDMPLVTPALIGALLGAYRNAPDAVAVVPVHAGERGNPVLLSATLFPELARLSGDAGARQVLRGRTGVIEVAAPDAAARVDIDTPDALRALDS
jgi:molybdenum cofactor cytidylyltransferase